MEATVSYISWGYISGLTLLLMGVVAPLVLLVARSKTTLKSSSQ
jgi:hypothetical protein